LVGAGFSLRSHDNRRIVLNLIERMPAWLRWAFVIAWCAGIYVVSDQPQLPGLSEYVPDAILKKTGHGAAYAALAMLLAHALHVGARPTARQLLIIGAIVAAYALIDEWHQSFVPNRSAQFVDALIDCAGALAGLVIWRVSNGAGWSRNRYWLLLAFALWALFVFNIPWRLAPPQNTAVLFTDPWLLFGFNYFGLLMMGVAFLMIEDAACRPTRPATAWFAAGAFALGIVPVSAYLALRPLQDAANARVQPRWVDRLRAARAPFWLLPFGAVVLALWLLPQGNWGTFCDAQLQFIGIGFMWLDIALNHIAVLPLVRADMQRTGARHQPMWLIAIALAGALALGVYLARRPTRF
jgi:VanZ family protein